MPASIYVTDDEPPTSQALVKRLSNGPHKIRAVKSRDELLVAVEQDVPDLVLIDIKMPGRFQVPSATSEYGVTTELEHVKKNSGGQKGRSGLCRRPHCLQRQQGDASQPSHAVLLHCEFQVFGLSPMAKLSDT
jgi:CheY-like chemotaxis protein